MQIPGMTDTPSGYVPCGSVSDAPWYCLVSKPRQETVALQELRQQRYAVYLPLWLATRPDRTRRIDPLFPRYLFAQPDAAGQWRPMRSTRGVATVLLGDYGFPAVVPRAVIAGLLAQCAPNGVIYPPEPDELCVGDTARIVTGALAEMAGICTRATKDRVWLLLSLMGRSVEVGMARDAVEAA